ERCHKLAFIASAKLLAQGSAAEILDSLHLFTWSIGGDNLAARSEQLRTAAGVEQTLVFGAALHVSGQDRGRLQSTLEQLAAAQPALHIEPIPTTLEHAFIYLMAHGGPAGNGAPALAPDSRPRAG